MKIRGGNIQRSHRLREEKPKPGRPCEKECSKEKEKGCVVGGRNNRASGQMECHRPVIKRNKRHKTWHSRWGTKTITKESDGGAKKTVRFVGVLKCFARRTGTRGFLRLQRIPNSGEKEVLSSECPKTR